MDNAQLYFAIGVPVFTVMVGIVAGILQMNSIGGRFTSMESRFTSMESRFTSTEGRFTTLESSFNARFTSLETSINTRFTSLDARFDTLTGKVIEIDNRLTRVESILERH